MSFVDCQLGGLAIGGYEGGYYGKQSDICGKTSKIEYTYRTNPFVYIMYRCCILG